MTRNYTTALLVLMSVVIGCSTPMRQGWASENSPEIGSAAAQRALTHCSEEARSIYPDANAAEAPVQFNRTVNMALAGIVHPRSPVSIKLSQDDDIQNCMSSQG